MSVKGFTSCALVTGKASASLLGQASRGISFAGSNLQNQGGESMIAASVTAKSPSLHSASRHLSYH